MPNFEIVSKYTQDDNIHLPTRATSNSAGYDFETAETVTVPSFFRWVETVENVGGLMNLEDAQKIIAKNNMRPTLIPTGVKCYLEPNTYLQLTIRSSTPLKSLLMLANGVGVIDADYADNPDNEGEIYAQVINLSPFDIVIPKGTRIMQGIILPYFKTDDDNIETVRTGGFGSSGQ